MNIAKPTTSPIITTRTIQYVDLGTVSDTQGRIYRTILGDKGEVVSTELIYSTQYEIHN